MPRLALGFFACALGLPIIIFVVGGRYVGGGVLSVLPFTVLGSAIFGAPLFFWHKKKGHLALRHFVVSGAGLGLLLALPFGLADLGLFSVFAAMFAAYGAIHAGAFWFIAVRGNATLFAEAKNVT